MAHELEMQAIAEGVETIHPLDPPRAAQCDCAQGWLFSHPLPAEHFAACLRENG